MKLKRYYIMNVYVMYILAIYKCTGNIVYFCLRDIITFTRWLLQNKSDLLMNKVLLFYFLLETLFQWHRLVSSTFVPKTSSPHTLIWHCTYLYFSQVLGKVIGLHIPLIIYKYISWNRLALAPVVFLNGAEPVEGDETRNHFILPT